MQTVARNALLIASEASLLLQKLTRRTRPYSQLQDAWPAVSASCQDEAQQTHAEVADALRMVAMVGVFRSRGHLAAKLDPLGRAPRGPFLAEAAERCTASGLIECGLPALLDGYCAGWPPARKAAYVAEQLSLQGTLDPTRRVYVGGALTAGEPGGRALWVPHELLEHLQAAYCSTLAVELDHLTSLEEQEWLARAVEARAQRPLPAQQQLGILRALLRTDMFERFLADRFPHSKRFGVEGCEALLPGLLAMAEHCASHGVQRLEVGMAHRGRLSVIHGLLGAPPGSLFAQMDNSQNEHHVGDVKYHLGRSATLEFPPVEQGQRPPRLRVSIAPNPSHLESIGPVVLGMVRAEQARLRDTSRTRVAGLLIHGDAAFPGLGIVAETLQLANVPGFTTGGTLHMVVNNQVGFTTEPADGRSSAHATDLAKAIGAPVLHVNADDPEAVVEACRIAADWRARFHKDVVVDLVGYRRHGHNEQDSPHAGLPLTYARVAAHPRVLTLYSERLVHEGALAPAQLDAWHEEVGSEFEREFAAAGAGKYAESVEAWLPTSWQGDALHALRDAGKGDPEPRQEPTGLPLVTLQWVGRSMCTVPGGFATHPDIDKLLAARRRMVAGEDSRVDFGMAEALALGTLALHRGRRPGGCEFGSDVGEQAGLPTEVVPGLLGLDPDAEERAAASMGLNYGAYAVRLSGQDSERGTFNHRTAVLYDQRTGARRLSLAHMQPGMQEAVEVWNSPLSEAAVLGFEYGFSLGAAGMSLVIWEAQFGDFANNAQAIIDQYVAAAEERWGQRSGLVLMLPHGYEGQGPDHSSARIERFLQLMNDDADHLPGHVPAQRREAAAVFAALARRHGGQLSREQTVALLASVGLGEGGEHVELLWSEMGLAPDAHITQDNWERLMVQYMRRNAERQANMFVVAASTPAQLFHALRRQMNRPFLKPLVLMTPKYLHHHRPATSTLHDMTSGTFFNRVIDDGKVSDNTRHRSRHPVTGELFLLPPDRIRRIVLCAGQFYYRLSNARRAGRIRDVVLVRLEQLAPFPHDLVMKVVSQYGNAELVWCQEEPKNMGAYRYVQPRLETAMRELSMAAFGVPPRALHYIGRTAAASAATASNAIHLEETKEIVDAALRGGRLCP
ncbi:hypothetical protein WJX81_005034 [Elliptochloris bilobata]|uniref:Transketolase-like pyrimidine-binding domain-containing protein n=1 Tax=Elliptochloris bilobata TaxID=381761 RepID=A0AAW1QP95_9CHLO